MRDIVQVHITAALPIRAQALPFANRIEVRFGMAFPAALIVDREPWIRSSRHSSLAETGCTLPAKPRRMEEARSGVMTNDKAAKPGPPRTLTQAHEELVGIRPSRNASLAAWLAYHQQSAALYAELAEIDRSHHHECLYWAERERESAEEVAGRIRTEGRK